MIKIEDIQLAFLEKHRNADLQVVHKDGIVIGALYVFPGFVTRQEGLRILKKELLFSTNLEGEEQ